MHVLVRRCPTSFSKTYCSSSSVSEPVPLDSWTVAPTPVAAFVVAAPDFASLMVVVDSCNAREPVCIFVTLSTLTLVVTPYRKIWTTVLMTESTQYGSLDFDTSLRKASLVAPSRRLSSHLFVSVNARGGLSTYTKSSVLTPIGRKLILRSKPLSYCS